MLGVDRLDMIKGIPQKLLAYEQFLEDNVEWRDKVLLVQIAVPTRIDVHECKGLLTFPPRGAQFDSEQLNAQILVYGLVMFSRLSRDCHVTGLRRPEAGKSGA